MIVGSLTSFLVLVLTWAIDRDGGGAGACRAMADHYCSGQFLGAPE